MTNTYQIAKKINVASLLKSLIMLAAIAAINLVSVVGFTANQSNLALASNVVGATVSYKITDGYGEYTGHGATKIQASSHAREACIMQKIAAYENRFGVTPDADTADMFIDACINR